MKTLILLLIALTLTACTAADVPQNPQESIQLTQSTQEEEPRMQSVTIQSGHTHTFDEGAFAQSFNRFTMTYTADEPFRCRISYIEDGEERSDDFFLEAGENRTFSGLIGHFLAGKKGNDLTSLTLDSCTDSDAQFLLFDFTTEECSVFSGNTYYIENDRFKVGIRLLWGGGICYISDVQNPIPGLTNLVNQADTGRLIQQSYYGTGPNGEYTPGTFNNSNWRYNPVQGGDKYQNHSRIIDIVTTETSVYVKSQPQDWSLDGQITPSYMENTYTLYDDHIRVDNRFVDFSGWEHPHAHQELPAFYTVSYLDRFTWYDGAKPWTGDTLSFRDDLNFWGDSRYAEDCRFVLRESNTETWCSWTKPDVDYGIGLYVPNADTYFAGKHAYNGSMDPYNGACNYVAPVNQMQMVSYQPIEYSYLMTTGSVEDIRATFAKHRDFSDNAALRELSVSLRIPDDTPVKPALDDIPVESLDLTVPENMWILSGMNNTGIDYDESEGAVRLTAKVGFDVQCGIDYSNANPRLKAEDCRKITVEYRIPEENAQTSYGCELFLCAGETRNAEAGKSVRGNYIADGEYHTIEFDLTGLDFWKGTVHSIRFDYFNECADGDGIYIRSIRMSK
ncbi:MAG: hypothetical protein J6C42_05495 [Clostridia bacterium]|nr:hypothetical protein [Clostridia bacterium]